MAKATPASPDAGTAAACVANERVAFQPQSAGFRDVEWCILSRHEISSCWDFRNGGRRVGRNLARQTIGRRIIALAVAYAVALSGLIASVAAANAAAAALADGPVPICHAAVQPSPAGSADHDSRKLCTACCIGCLTAAATQPSPPAVVAGAPQSPSHKLTNGTASALAAGRQARSHQSRAPPPRA
jgi:hypothetical protein